MAGSSSAASHGCGVEGIGNFILVFLNPFLCVAEYNFGTAAWSPAVQRTDAGGVGNKDTKVDRPVVRLRPDGEVFARDGLAHGREFPERHAELVSAGDIQNLAVERRRAGGLGSHELGKIADVEDVSH